MNKENTRSPAITDLLRMQSELNAMSRLAQDLETKFFEESLKERPELTDEHRQKLCVSLQAKSLEWSELVNSISSSSVKVVRLLLGYGVIFKGLSSRLVNTHATEDDNEEALEAEDERAAP